MHRLSSIFASSPSLTLPLVYILPPLLHPSILHIPHFVSSIVPLPSVASFFSAMSLAHPSYPVSSLFLTRSSLVSELICTIFLSSSSLHPPCPPSSTFPFSFYIPPSSPHHRPLKYSGAWRDRGEILRRDGRFWEGNNKWKCVKASLNDMEMVWEFPPRSLWIITFSYCSLGVVMMMQIKSTVK